MKSFSLILLVVVLSVLSLLEARSIYEISFEEKQDSPLFDGAEVRITSSNQMIQLTSGQQIPLLKVPDGLQFYQQTSGQCCLEVVFGYYHFHSAAEPYREDFLINRINMDEYNFTNPQNLIAAAKSRINNETVPERLTMFDLSVEENMSARKLEEYLKAEIPVILLIKKRPSLFQGSYVVAIGYDDNNIYIQDPFKMGSISYIAKGQLDAIWKTYIRSEKRNTNHLGIVIKYRINRSILVVPMVNPSP